MHRDCCHDIEIQAVPGVEVLESAQQQMQLAVLGSVSGRYMIPEQDPMLLRGTTGMSNMVVCMIFSDQV